MASSEQASQPDPNATVNAIVNAYPDSLTLADRETPFMAGLVLCVCCTRAAASIANANPDPTTPADQFMAGAW